MCAVRTILLQLYDSFQQENFLCRGASEKVNEHRGHDNLTPIHAGSMRISSESTASKDPYKERLLGPCGLAVAWALGTCALVGLN